MFQALFLIGMALNEEDRDSKEDCDKKIQFTAAATDESRDRNLLSWMTSLVGTSEAKSASSLLNWTISVG